MEEQDAKNWLNLSMKVLRACQSETERRLGSEVDAPETWEQLGSFLQVIARKMEESH
jgi:hypothetical protein